MSRFNPKKMQNLIKFFFEEVEQFVERYEKHSSPASASASKDPVQMPIAESGPDAEMPKTDSDTDSQPETDTHADEQPYSPATVPLDQTQANVNVPAPSAETASAFENAPVESAGVQSAPVGAVSPLTVDGATVPLSEPDAADPKETPPETPKDESDPMIIKSTDGVGPDIEMADPVNATAAATINDGKPIDESDAVDTSTGSKPTPIGAFASQSVNGPVQDGSEQADKDAGNADKFPGTTTPADTVDPAGETQTAKGDPSVAGSDIDIKNDKGGFVPAAQAAPENETDVPAVQTTDPDTAVLKNVAPSDDIASAVVPNETLVNTSANVIGDETDTPKVEKPETDDSPDAKPEEAFPTSTVDIAETPDKEAAPSILGDDAVPSNAAAPSSIDKSDDSSTDSSSSNIMDETAVIDKSDAPSTTKTEDLGIKETDSETDAPASK